VAVKLDRAPLGLRVHGAFAHADEVQVDFYDPHLFAEDLLRNEGLLKKTIEKTKLRTATLRYQ